MFEEERQSRIMNELTEHRSMSVADLARILNVSGSTIRRDLTSMEQNGLIHPWRRDDCGGSGGKSQL